MLECMTWWASSPPAKKKGQTLSGWYCAHLRRANVRRLAFP